jgi:hypothetical protein
MIRYDENLRAYMVPMSDDSYRELSANWSEPLQMQIHNEELVLRRPEPPWYQSVTGKCPECGGGLVLNHWGIVRCKDLDCKDPNAASRLLRGEPGVSPGPS